MQSHLLQTNNFHQTYLARYLTLIQQLVSVQESVKPFFESSETESQNLKKSLITIQNNMSYLYFNICHKPYDETSNQFKNYLQLANSITKMFDLLATLMLASNKNLAKTEFNTFIKPTLLELSLNLQCSIKLTNDLYAWLCNHPIYSAYYDNFTQKPAPLESKEPAKLSTFVPQTTYRPQQQLIAQPTPNNPATSVLFKKPPNILKKKTKKKSTHVSFRI